MKKRELYIDMLNIVACFCVICMHCNGIVHIYTGSLAWKQSMVVETIAYWAVPVFFMLSGATLINYRERYDTKTYLLKRVIRVGVPFIAWSIINLIWKSYAGGIELKCSVPYMLSLFLNNKIENVYWFFIPLFSCYLCIPVLSLLKNNRRMMKYLVACGLVTHSVLPVLCQLCGLEYNSSLYFPMTGGYIIYVILGYLLSTEDFNLKQRYILYGSAVLCAMLRYFSTVIISEVSGEFYKVFWGYTNFPTVGLAMGVFVLFKYIKWDKLFSSISKVKILTSVASASFGIYLIHMIVMNVFYWYGVNTQGLKWRVIGPVLVYIISLIIVKLLQKVPIIKKIIP